MNAGVRLNELGLEFCTKPGCDRPYYAKGFCARHHQEYLRRLKGVKPRPEHDALCTVLGCDAPYYARGRCEKHYKRRYRKTRLSQKSVA